MTRQLPYHFRTWYGNVFICRTTFDQISPIYLCYNLPVPNKRFIFLSTFCNSLLILHTDQDRTDRLDLVAVARDFVAKNEQRLMDFGQFQTSLAIVELAQNVTTGMMLYKT